MFEALSSSANLKHNTDAYASEATLTFLYIPPFYYCTHARLKLIKIPAEFFQ